MNRIQQHHFPEKESTPCTSSSPAAAAFSAGGWRARCWPAARWHWPAPRPGPSRASRWPTACRRRPTCKPTPACSSRRAICASRRTTVSGECEADFDLGMRSTLDATRMLLQACRHAGHAPVFVFSSSVAVFGGSPEQPLPAVIEDSTLPTPQSSYGIQKFIGEQLVADFSRKGFVQGRSVRLMTVSVRPGRPNGAASGFLSGMLREPLAGERARCPVAPETPVALASPGNTVAGIIRAASASAAEWRVRTAVNLPALTTTVREMAQALEHVAGRAASALIDWDPDAQIAKIVTSWPSRIHAARAQSLGLSADPSFDAILRSYLRENPQAHQWPRQ